MWQPSLVMLFLKSNAPRDAFSPSLPYCLPLCPFLWWDVLGAGADLCLLLQQCLGKAATQILPSHPHVSHPGTCDFNTSQVQSKPLN